MMIDDTIRLLEELLAAAAEAHGIHEKEDLGGVYDEQWPEWYAAHMSTALSDRGLRLREVDVPPGDDSAREELREAPQTTQ